MTNKKTIYLDNAASTIPNEEIKKVYIDTINSYYANPSAIHHEGQFGAYRLSSTHDEICSLLRLNNREIVFTSGATEANNLAIRGYCLKYKNRGNHLITSTIEHPSVLNVFSDLEENYGFKVSYIKPTKEGIITAEAVKKEIKDDTILVSIMSVNNETGAINEIDQIASLLANYPKINFHVDNVQGFSKLQKPFDYNKIDMMVIAGHKIYGLIGCGLLIKRKGLDLKPILIGGGQENGLRSGTSDLAALLAMKEAISFSVKNYKSHYESVKVLSDYLKDYIVSRPDDFELNSYSDNPYIVNFSTKLKKASVVVEALSNKGIMVSSTSACHSHGERNSYVIHEMKGDDNLSKNTIRVSFGYYNTLDDVKALCLELDNIIKGIRNNG